MISQLMRTNLLIKFIYKLIDMMCINKNNLDNILKYKK